MTAVTDGAAEVGPRPAKVNVHLAVGPLRPDGFHELRTVYLAVSLFDTVTVRPGNGLSLTVTGEGAGAVRGADRADRSAQPRLAGRRAARRATPGCAADADARRSPSPSRPPPGWPAAAPTPRPRWSRWTRCGAPGPAGRISLASPRSWAATSRSAWSVGSPSARAAASSSRRSWRARGRHWVLGIAGEGLSTPAVYAELDRLRAAGRVPDGTELTAAEPAIAALRSGPTAAAGRVAGQRSAGAGPGAASRARAAPCAPPPRPARPAALVSGSGPTVAVLADDERDAVRLDRRAGRCRRLPHRAGRARPGPRRAPGRLTRAFRRPGAPRRGRVTRPGRGSRWARPL